MDIFVMISYIKIWLWNRNWGGFSSCSETMVQNMLSDSLFSWVISLWEILSYHLFFDIVSEMDTCEWVNQVESKFNCTLKLDLYLIENHSVWFENLSVQL